MLSTIGSSTSKPVQRTEVKENNPHIKGLHFLLGTLLYPVVLDIQIIAQQTLKTIGFQEISTDDLVERISERLGDLSRCFSDEDPEIRPLQIPMQLSESVGKAIFFQDFVQSYLLDQKLTLLLRKFSPEWQNFPGTTRGKISRVVVTSLLFTAFQPLLKGMCYSPTTSPIAIRVNDFICGIFCAALKEYTSSGAPSIAINIMRDYIGVIY